MGGVFSYKIWGIFFIICSSKSNIITHETKIIQSQMTSTDTRVAAVSVIIKVKGV